MAKKDIDKLHAERIANLIKKSDGEPTSLVDLFTSERVLETLRLEKVFFNGYRTDKILAAIPYAPVVYVTICPLCVASDELDAFSKLTAAGLVIPILTSKYSLYPEALRNTVIGRDHVSGHEYQAYRYYSIAKTSSRMICQHCAAERFKKMRSSVRRFKDASEFSVSIDRLKENVYPLVHPDFELLDLADEACRARDISQLRQLRRLSEGLHQLRDSQAFNSALTLGDEDLSGLPRGISNETDQTMQSVQEMRKTAAAGLGLTIPLDIPVDRYIELAKDYQPKISEVITSVFPGDQISSAAAAKLTKSMAELNREMERVQGLKRYALLEASMAVFRQHKPVLVTALIASAFGLAGSLTGCAGAVATGAGVKIAKSRGWLNAEKNEAVAKMGRMVARDLQPHLDKLIAFYAGSSVRAINVLSLRKKLTARKAA